LKKTQHTHTQKADGVAQGVGPEFELQYHKKNKHFSAMCNIYNNSAYKKSNIISYKPSTQPESKNVTKVTETS
jgi:hypothetical protein